MPTTIVIPRWLLVVIALLAAIVCLLVINHAVTVADQRRPDVHGVKSVLLQAFDAKTRNVIFTNPYRDLCRVVEYTNYHLISGTGYQCVLAADSWDYQGLTNLLAITTNRLYLYIGKSGTVEASGFPPGY
jgi:hypothetical protein